MRTVSKRGVCAKRGERGGGEEDKGVRQKETYGSLSTCLGVSDGDPFTTVGSSCIDTRLNCADIVAVAACQRYPRLERDTECMEKEKSRTMTKTRRFRLIPPISLCESPLASLSASRLE